MQPEYDSKLCQHMRHTAASGKHNNNNNNNALLKEIICSTSFSDILWSTRCLLLLIEVSCNWSIELSTTGMAIYKGLWSASEV